MSEHLDPADQRAVPNPSETTSPSELTWEDLVRLSQMSLGLRHVPNEAKARNEVENGIRGGDALALSAVSQLLTSTPGLTPSVRGLALMSDLAKTQGSISVEDRQRILRQFQTSVRAFIAYGVGDVMNHLLTADDTIEVALGKVAHGSSFILADYGLSARMGYEHRGYYGLGKCGSGDIPSDRIRGAVFPPSGNDISKQFAPAQLTTSVTSNFQQVQGVLVNHYWQGIVKAVRR